MSTTFSTVTQFGSMRWKNHCDLRNFSRCQKAYSRFSSIIMSRTNYFVCSQFLFETTVWAYSSFFGSLRLRGTQREYFASPEVFMKALAPYHKVLSTEKICHMLFSSINAFTTVTFPLPYPILDILHESRRQNENVPLRNLHAICTPFNETGLHCQ